MGATVKGGKELRLVLGKLSSAQGLQRIILPPMTMGAERMMTTAKRRTPVDTGALRASGRVYRGMISPRVTVMLGFHTSYAAAVHENLYAKHPHGQAKYLSSAVEDHVKDLERYIARSITNAVKTGAV